MNTAWLQRTACAALIAATSTGCAAIDPSTRTGAAAARLTIGDLPDDCRVQEPHAPLVDGAEARSVLKRERAALDRANARVARCAAHHDDLVEHLERS